VSDHNRREFLKRGVVVGGAVWATPAIATVSSSVATGSPAPCCTTRSAFGLAATGLVTIGPLGVAGSGQECTISTGTIGIGPLASVSADVVCGHFGPGCSSQACVTNVHVTVPGTTLSIQNFQTCVSVGSPGLCGYCAAATGVLTLNGSNVPLPTGCNAALINVPGLTVTFNQQSCSNGTLTATGLVIDVLSGIETIAVSQASAGCNTCTSCTPCPTCSSCSQCAAGPG
jgi:hypothetical protein